MSEIADPRAGGARVARILAASQALETLRAGAKDASLRRDGSEVRRQEWHSAASAFQSGFDRLWFPGGTAAFVQAKAADSQGVEAATWFLLADPMHFRSGYAKQVLWGVMSRVPLSAGQRSRLERAALRAIERRIAREFWSMAKAMARIGGESFWAQIVQRATTENPIRAFRARGLLAYRAGAEAGAMFKRIAMRQWLLAPR